MSSSPHAEPAHPSPDGRLEPVDRTLLGEALVHGLREPLSALRASLEALARSDRDREHGRVAEHAVLEVARLGRTVQDLIDFVAPAPMRAMRTSLDEIVEAALSALGEERERVLVAVEHGADPLHVDGPRLARCLSLLLLEALRSGPGEVLLHTRTTKPRTSVICVTREIAVRPPLDNGTSPSVASLARGLAERELARLGGRLAVRTKSSHSLELALAPAGEDGAEADGEERAA